MIIEKWMVEFARYKTSCFEDECPEIVSTVDSTTLFDTREEAEKRVEDDCKTILRYVDDKCATILYKVEYDDEEEEIVDTESIKEINLAKLNVNRK